MSINSQILRRGIASLLAVLFALGSARAQEAPDGFLESFIGHFNYASRVLQLAEAMPADAFEWSPGDEVMSVQQVYMHIARYNYLYPVTSLEFEPPEGINLDTMEEITGKEEVVRHLEESIEYVRDMASRMSSVELAQTTTLYGREVQAWQVLLQLVTHMSEHVGQSIAYARMNDVAPPWSR